MNKTDYLCVQVINKAKKKMKLIAYIATLLFVVARATVTDVYYDIKLERLGEDKKTLFGVLYFSDTVNMDWLEKNFDNLFKFYEKTSDGRQIDKNIEFTPYKFSQDRKRVYFSFRFDRLIETAHLEVKDYEDIGNLFVAGGTKKLVTKSSYIARMLVNVHYDVRIDSIDDNVAKGHI